MERRIFRARKTRREDGGQPAKIDSVSRTQKKYGEKEESTSDAYDTISEMDLIEKSFADALRDKNNTGRLSDDVEVLWLKKLLSFFNHHKASCVKFNIAYLTNLHTNTRSQEDMFIQPSCKQSSEARAYLYTNLLDESDRFVNYLRILLPSRDEINLLYRLHGHAGNDELDNFQ